MPTIAAMKRLIDVARGLVVADLVLTNARILNTFTGEIEPGNIAIAAGHRQLHGGQAHH